MFTDRISRRILASMLGSALGDSLGLALDGADPLKTPAKSPEAPVMKDGRYIVSAATQMALFSAEGMIQGYFRTANKSIGAEIEDYVAESYACWMMTQDYPPRTFWNDVFQEPLWAPTSRLIASHAMRHRRNPGKTCKEALFAPKKGTTADPVNQSKGCAAVGRTGPFGFLATKKTDRTPYGPAVRCGARCAALTHGHPLGWLPGGLHAEIVHACLYGRHATLQEAILSALDALRAEYGGLPDTLLLEGRIRKAIQMATDGRLHSSEEIASELGLGKTGDEALAIAVFSMVRMAYQPVAAMRCAVAQSLYSCTCGAIVGSVLGAWAGLSALPMDWADKLEVRKEIDELAVSIRSAMDLQFNFDPDGQPVPAPNGYTLSMLDVLPVHSNARGAGPCEAQCLSDESWELREWLDPWHEWSLTVHIRPDGTASGYSVDQAKDPQVHAEFSDEAALQELLGRYIKPCGRLDETILRFCEGHPIEALLDCIRQLPTPPPDPEESVWDFDTSGLPDIDLN